MSNENNSKKKRTFKELRKAYKGSISTIFITFFIIMFGLFLPMLSANEVQKAREGEGFYSPEENIIWDLNGHSDFEPIQYKTNEDDLGNAHRTSTTVSVNDREVDHSVWWKYKSWTGTAYINVLDGVTQSVIFDDIGQENAVDNYMIYNFIADGRKTDDSVYPHDLSDNILHNNEGMRMYLKIDSDRFLEDDATKISVWSDYDISGLEDYPNEKPSFRIEFRSEKGAYIIQDWTYHTVGEKMEFQIDIDDLVGIASLQGDKEYIFVWERVKLNKEDDFKDATPYLFDFQLHGLLSKKNSITILSIWNIVNAIGMYLMAVVMLPQISFGGLAKRLNIASD